MSDLEAEVVGSTMSISAIFGHDWQRRPSVTATALRALEGGLGGSLPADYLSLLKWSNGGEGRLGKAYLSLWRAEEIIGLNFDYSVQTYLPALVAIGTDAGGTCIAIEIEPHCGTKRYVQVPLGDLAAQSVVFLGDDLEAAVETLKAFGFR